MTTALIKPELITKMRDIAERGREYASQLVSADEVGRQIIVFQAVTELASMLSDEIVGGITKAAGTGLTFKMDKPNYPPAVIRNCVAEALIRGLSLVGNEFNVIAGNFYCTKEGWLKRLKTLGARRVQVVVGNAENITEKPTGDRGAIKVTAAFAGEVTCELNGKTERLQRVKTDAIDGRVVVTAFGYDVVDCLAGLKGKAEGRLLRAMFFMLADEPDNEPDLDVIETPSVQVIDASFKPVEELALPYEQEEKPAAEEKPAKEKKQSAKVTSAKDAIAKAASEDVLFKIMEQAAKYVKDGSITEDEFAVIETMADEKRSSLNAT